MVDGTGFARDRGQARSYRDRANFENLSSPVERRACRYCSLGRSAVQRDKRALVENITQQGFAEAGFTGKSGAIHRAIWFAVKNRFHALASSPTLRSA